MTSVLHRHVDPSEPFDAVQYAFRLGRTLYLREYALDLCVLRAKAALARRPIHREQDAPKLKPQSIKRTKMVVDLLNNYPMTTTEIRQKLNGHGTRLNRTLDYMKSRRMIRQFGGWRSKWHLTKQV